LGIKNGGGPGSGIWKTTDAGKTWKKLEGSGLPAGLLGRIGLEVSRSNSNHLYAQMEVGASTGNGGEDRWSGGGAANPRPSPSPSHHKCFAGRESSRLTNADAADPKSQELALR